MFIQLEKHFENICNAKKSPEIILYYMYICTDSRGAAHECGTHVYLKFHMKISQKKEYVSIIFSGKRKKPSGTTH